MTYTPWSGVTATEVKNNVGIDSKTAGFATDEAYTTWITDNLLSECEGHIQAHCRRTLSTEFSSMTASDQNAIKGVVRRMVSNAIQVTVANKSGSVVNLADYKVDWPNRKIFTDDLKDLLKPYVSVSYTSLSASSTCETDNMKSRWDED